MHAGLSDFFENALLDKAWACNDPAPTYEEVSRLSPPYALYSQRVVTQEWCASLARWLFLMEYKCPLVLRRAWSQKGVRKCTQAPV